MKMGRLRPAQIHAAAPSLPIGVLCGAIPSRRGLSELPSPQATLHQQSCTLLSNTSLCAGYWRATFKAGAIAADAAPGQFVHLQLPGLEGHLLRRPFSICDATADGILTIVYKVVGAGSQRLSELVPGTTLDIMGPLGHGFAPVTADRPALLVAGGYGCAAMYFVARQAAAAGCPPVILLGARSEADLLLRKEFAELGCRVEAATNDGSCGIKGLVTVLLENELQRTPNALVEACGPMPMLKATAQLCQRFPNAACQVSLDEIMCCGVGACFGCVIKCKDSSQASGWSYRRSCKEGPVFEAEEVYWE